MALHSTISGRYFRIILIISSLEAALFIRKPSANSELCLNFAPKILAALAASSSRISGVPRVPSSPLVRARSPTCFPTLISFAKVAAHPNSTSSGWAPTASISIFIFRFYFKQFLYIKLVFYVKWLQKQLQNRLLNPLLLLCPQKTEADHRLCFDAFFLRQTTSHARFWLARVLLTPPLPNSWRVLLILMILKTYLYPGLPQFQKKACPYNPSFAFWRVYNPRGFLIPGNIRFLSKDVSPAILPSFWHFYFGLLLLAPRFSCSFPKAIRCNRLGYLPGF